MRAWPGELGQLSNRAANALLNSGITTREQFRQAVADANYLVGKWRGLGRRSLAESLTWAGLDVPGYLKGFDPKEDPPHLRCPHCRKSIYIQVVKEVE